MSEARFEEYRRDRRAALALGGAGAVALVLWAAAAVHAGGGLPEEKKARPAPRRPSTGTPTFRPGMLPDVAKPLVLEGELKHLRAAQLAPRNCPFFATIRDISRAKTRFEELAVAKILRDPAIASRFASVIETMRESARSSAKPGVLGFAQMVLATEVDYARARALFRKEVAFVGLPSGEKGGVRLALVAALRGNRDDLDEVLESLMGEMLTQYPQFSSSEREHAGARIRSLVSAGFEVSFAYYENLFIVGTGRDTIQKLIDTCEAGSRKQLAGDKVFKQAEEKIGKGADIFYRIDLAGLAKVLAGKAVPAADGFNRTAIPPQSGALWGSVRLDGQAVRERLVFTGVPAEDGSVVRAVTGNEALISPPKTIGYFPVDTVFYYVATLDPRDVISRMREDPRSAKWVSDLMGTINRYLGADLEKDVLRAFGGELAFGAIIPPGRPAEFLIAFEVKRPDLLKRATEVIEGFMKVSSGAEVRQRVYRDHRIRYLEPPEKVTRPTLMQLLFPDLAYARPKEGEPFLLASSRRALEKAIRQQEHGRSVLTEKPDYERCTGGLRSKRTTLLYTDLRAALDFLRGQIPAAVGPTVTGPLARSSGVDVIAPHMFGFGGVVDMVRTSVSMESYGPLGPMSGVALLSFGRLGEKGKEGSVLEDQEKLRAVGAALHLYATDFDRFPRAFSELYSEYLPRLSDLESPDGRHAVKTKDDIDTKGDYVYVPGLSPMDLSSLIIAYGRRHATAWRGRNVLYLSGLAAYLEEADFQRVMERQRSERAGR